MKYPILNKKNTLIAVFSYNRGRFLKNCVRSVEKHIPGFVVHIYDDGSDDKQTKEILKNLSKKHFVFINNKKNKNSERGGLYYNMNKALDDALKKNYSYVFFIQEDAQIVRDCDEHFFEGVAKLFSQKERLLSVYPIFLKGDQRNSLIVPMDDGMGYIYKNHPYAAYDQGIYNVILMKKIGWRFDSKESFNVKKAEKEELRCVIHRDSVMMFLPNSQIRHRDSTIKRTFVRIIEMIFGFGYYPYRSMTKEEVQSFLARNIREKPFAEDYLYTVKKTRKPWKYARSDYPFINTYIFIKKYLQK